MQNLIDVLQVKFLTGLVAGQPLHPRELSDDIVIQA